MHRARNIVFVVVIAGAIMACALGSAAPASDGNVATIVASTLQALTPVASTVPAVTATSKVAQPQGVPVDYKNVSFVLPTGLAVDAAPTTVPALTDPNSGPGWDLAPEYVEFHLDGYNVPANSFSLVQIRIYPASEYAKVSTGANISLQRLQGILGNPSAAPDNDTLPQVPYFNAQSMFAAQVERIHFTNGNGVRMVTQYGQAVGPVANSGTFYHFQGLTGDGKYYIVAVLPVQAPFLQSANDPNAGVPAEGIPFPGYGNMGDQKVYQDYFAAISNKLDATPADQFTPSLAALDALVQSFKVGP